VQACGKGAVHEDRRASRLAASAASAGWEGHGMRVSMLSLLTLKVNRIMNFARELAGPPSVRHGTVRRFYSWHRNHSPSKQLLLDPFNFEIEGLDRFVAAQFEPPEDDRGDSAPLPVGVVAGPRKSEAEPAETKPRACRFPCLAAVRREQLQGYTAV
jgi:hypothetical protein